MSPLFAYIGPGAGFAFLGSFLSLIASFFLTAAALLLWPFRTARAAIRRKLNERRAEARKLNEHRAEAPELTEHHAEARKLNEHPAEAPKLNEHHPESPKLNEHRAESPKLNEHHAEVPKLNEHHAEAPKLNERRAESPKLNEQHPESPKLNERHAEAPKPRVRRVIFLGFDGLDPRLTERYMAEGKLPNFSRLKEMGSFHRLRTTFPALSPVAWSTFATGVSPAKHNIFDFLNRSLKTYIPELAPSKVRPARRILRIGRLRLPLSRPVVEMHRKSESFWKILGEHSIGSTILRVPVTFPPEDFNGRLLSAMCTPDLRGTQGSFTFFSTNSGQREMESGNRCALRQAGGHLGGHLEGSLAGPENDLFEGAETLAIPFQLTVESAADCALLTIAGQSHRLKRSEYSPWIRLSFAAAPGVHIHGIARFLLTETSPAVSLYVTPIQIDPENPALPISHPAYYSQYLAKLLGSYATVGMAEDTWALNEGAINEAEFLTQAYSIMDERAAMFHNALERTKRGVLACIVDTSDRVQHMFFRHLDGLGDVRWSGVIPDLYQRMDGLLGKAMEHLDEGTVLFALSDHGFCAFRRAVNLNSWLHQHGYLALTEDRSESGRYFQGVDWARTRAYCLGLSGLYLNLRGRESLGTVAPGAEAEALKTELIARLSGLRDEERDDVAIRRVYATDQLYRGPYLGAAPDLIVGFNEGYRTSWDAAVGKVTAAVIEDNPKAWSGDHSVDPLLVPGVLFSSRKIDGEDPGIEDMAPTALDLFGLPAPAWMDGKSVFNSL